MPDIGDFFSSTSKTKTSPQKAYKDTFTTTSTSFVDVTSVTLSVPNNSYYAIVFYLQELDASRTATAQLLEGATTKQTWTVTSGGGGSSTNTYETSSIYQNTSGSTQTVKLQLKAGSTATSGASVTLAMLICGSYIVPVTGTTPIMYPLNCYVTDLEVVGATNSFDVYCNNVTQIQNSTTTGSKSSQTEYVNGFICQQLGGTVLGFIGFDWAGKYVVVT